LLKIDRGCTLSEKGKYKERRHTPMKSPTATPEKRVKETEVNVQQEIWKFIAATLKQGLSRLLEGLLEDEVTTKVNARKYERSYRRRGIAAAITSETWLPVTVFWKVCGCLGWRKDLWTSSSSTSMSGAAQM
jgi:hypothetical protein